MKRIALFLVVFLTACESDLWTSEGGVVTRTFWTKARGSDGFNLYVAAPGGGQRPSEGLHRGVVLSPGGFVSPSEYTWLAKALAARGYVVAVPEFPLDLGFFTADNASVARRVLVEGDLGAYVHPLSAEGDVVAMGHSLGGVVSSSTVVKGGYAALVLLASQAASTDPVEDLKIPVLSVAGARDCDIGPDAARESAKRFKNVLFAEIDLLTHYGFTNSVRTDLEAGCPALLPIGEGHDRIIEVIDLFLKSRLDADVPATARLNAGLQGVTLVAGGAL